ncbi:MAG: hypothetical protein Ct9H300mP1_06650 [Planctomycetaceae bacterium]|nr:MAG: hypothetical protein Ct9H300mP1_06650 [Planctomycetaceae bacterium]
MDRTRFEKPPRWWGPQLSPLGVRLSGWLRRMIISKGPRISEVEVRGAEHVRGALDAGNGILITPNHSVHGDPRVVYTAAEKFGSPLYFMGPGRCGGWSTRFDARSSECTGVQRRSEGTDRQAMQQAVDVCRIAKSRW